MFLNYLVSAWRNVLNNRLFSSINVFGLAIGFMSFILILLFVRDELSYDRWIPGSERLVRLHTGYYPGDRPPFETVRSAGRMMAALRDYVPQLETGVRLVQAGVTVKREEALFNESLVLADATFFDLFDLPLVQGEPLSKPLDLIISESAALKYFGRTQVVGESLTLCCIGEPITVQITGVLRDLPQNTHLDLEFLTYLEPSWFKDMPNILETWTSVNTFTYFRLAPGTDIEEAQSRVTFWIDNESPFVDMMDAEGKPSDTAKLKLMSVPDLHLHAERDAGNIGDMRPLGDISLVYTFAAIAALILLIASINFMNLATARAAHRSREVALRKVMGASRFQVALQFLGEALAISGFALLLSLVAVEVILPAYNTAIDRELSFVLINDMPLLLTLLGVTFIVGILSGSYPALYLSSVLPARILKSNQNRSGSTRVRSFLVVLQFAISISLAVCTLVVYGQMLYARAIDTGYVVEDKLVLNGLSRLDDNSRRALANELRRIDGVSSVVLSSEVPSQDNENNTLFTPMDVAPTNGLNGDGEILNYYSFGFGFMEAYQMELLAGRSFDETRSSDLIKTVKDDQVSSASLVINASAARALGFDSPEAAIGQVLSADVFRAGPHELTIIGVARDVYFRSIKFGIRPSVFFNHPVLHEVATVSFASSNPGELQRNVERTWKQHAPDVPVSHRFLTDMVNAQYQAEERQSQLLAVFSCLALVVACLGLYGLAAFTAERRTREIGIRKVMGARIRDIVRLLIWQFSVPVLIANLFAWPVAFILMSGWLENYHYRLDQYYIIMAAAVVGASALLIAWLTVAARAYAVASANPVNALRYE